MIILKRIRKHFTRELTRENNTEMRWKEHFFQLMNNDEISEIGGNVRKARITGSERVVREMGWEEITGTLKKVKSGRADGTDSTVAKM